MNRNENNTIRDIFKSVHAQRNDFAPSPQWRRSVMMDVSSMDIVDDMETFNDLAPRFTLAATAILVVTLAIGLWTIPGLFKEIQMAYTSMALDATSNLWAFL
ncbi:hypothetical protein [Pseudodesulfovibrio sediminis]|uniref:Uncharacterized protein n=1 Tax=Pseudodesulfovibrio sediminis TaxID=2810563 RepID=A0ABM7P5V6_9BACT|nr:hypothetical protein [Pseudodesulfovibrio sediminis]BCS88234.1 hypothetical protein PSDVSF_14760 [Pseudodesulfovibrio sediminis]